MNELDKWANVNDEGVQAIQEFFEFLTNKKQYSLCKLVDERFFPTNDTLLLLIYEFHGIDPIKLEKERRKLLESVSPK
jgi:hypothetical protein